MVAHASTPSTQGLEFQASLSFRVRPFLKKGKRKKIDVTELVVLSIHETLGWIPSN